MSTQADNSPEANDDQPLILASSQVVAAYQHAATEQFSQNVLLKGLVNQLRSENHALKMRVSELEAAKE